MKRPAAQQAFLAVAAVVRALPRVRGKVRLGLAAYRLLNRHNRDFVAETTLFPERLKFVLNLTSAHERMALLMNGYEFETTDVLDALWSGGAVLDVGANIGLIALPLAERLRRRDPDVRVFALEAIRSNFEALQRNIAANALEGVVTPLAVAAGAETRDVLIEIEGDDPSRTGTANILPESLAGHARLPLRVRAIDELCAEGMLPSDVSAIKIDTDGYDLEVLRGARTLLMERRPAVLAELNPVCLGWHGQSISDVITFAESVGYEVWPPDAYAATTFHRYRSGEVNLGDSLLLPRERSAELIARLRR
jgi:FkbM family methyltransferase